MYDQWYRLDDIVVTVKDIYLGVQASSVVS
jgi:hypothetical protein